MTTPVWLVRECPEGHGLISVDGEDLDACPAPNGHGGQCGAALSESFIVKQARGHICTIGGCGASFGSENVLDHHKAKPHLQCPDCPRKFTKRGLGVHRRVMHPQPN